MTAIKTLKKQLLNYLAKFIDSDIAMILVISFVLNIIGIWWGLPSWEGWAPDEIRPELVISGALSLFSAGWHSVYPPFHYYVLSALYLPLYIPLFVLDKLSFIEIQTPIVENSTTGLFYFTYLCSFLLGRFLCVIMGTATVFLVYLCGREIYSKQEALIAALTTSLLTPFVYYAKIINVEIPYIFWFCLSLLFYIRILKSHRTFDYLFFAVTSTIAICTKDQAYGFYILTIVHILILKYIQDKKYNQDISWVQSIFDKKIIYSLSLAIILFIVIHNIVFNYNGFVDHVELLVGPASYDSYDFFARDDNNWMQHLELFWQSVRNMIFSLTLPMFIICTIGILSNFLQYKNKNNYLLLSLLVPVISYYLFFISIILYSRTRFLIPVCIIFSFFGAQFISKFLLKRKRFLLPSKIFSYVFVSLVFIYMFAHAFSVDLIMVNDSRYIAETKMDSMIPASAKVLGIGINKYLPRTENRKFELLTSGGDELSAQEIKKINSGYYDYIVTTSAFNVSQRFDESSGTYQVVKKIIDGNADYPLLFKQQFQPKFHFLELEGVSSNINKINPEITVYIKKKNLPSLESSHFRAKKLRGVLGSEFYDRYRTIGHQL